MLLMSWRAKTYILKHLALYNLKDKFIYLDEDR